MACMFIAVLVIVVISSVNELAGHAEKYTKRVNSMVQWVVRWGELFGMDISTEAMTEKLTHHTAFLSELVVKGVSVVAEELSNGFLSEKSRKQALAGHDERGRRLRRSMDIDTDTDKVSDTGFGTYAVTHTTCRSV